MTQHPFTAGIEGALKILRHDVVDAMLLDPTLDRDVDLGLLQRAKIAAPRAESGILLSPLRSLP